MFSRPRTQSLTLLKFGVALALLYAFRDVLWPLAVALVLAILINAAARRVAMIFPKAGRWTVFGLTAFIVGGLILASMYVVASGVSRMIAQTPHLIGKLNVFLAAAPTYAPIPRSLSELGRGVDIGGFAGQVASALQDALSGLGLTVLYLVFLLATRRAIEKRMAKIVKQHASSAAVDVIQRSMVGVGSYMYIQTVTGLMIAAGAAIVMLAAGLDNWAFWALAMFLLSFLPVIGVLLGALGPTAFAIVQFPSVWPAILIFVGMQIVAFIVGNLVLPKMQADSQNIDPTASLVAIGFWTILWGAPGAFLAIPLTLAVMYALAHYPHLEWIAILISNDGDPTPVALAETASEPVA
jgi:predicted PurR-regulated permease PerM